MNDQDSGCSRLVGQAIAHHDAGRLREAENLYLRVLAGESNHGDALHGLGILYWQLGQLDAAHQYLTKAIASDSNVWRYFCTLGRYYAAIGRMLDAALAFERAKDLNPDSALVWFCLADALHALSRFDESANSYRQSLVLQPDNADVYNNLGVVLNCMGNWNDAIAAFRQGLFLRPDIVELYNNLGNALLNARYDREAIAIFRQALVLNQNSSELWFNYGNALAKLSASQEAVDAYRQALAIEPEHSKALVNLANILRLRGELDEAIALYKSACVSDPGFYDAYNNAGVALLSKGRVDDAIAVLEQAISLQPNTSIAYNNLGNVFKDAGRLDEAIACYRRAMVLDSHNVEAHGNLVYAVSFHPGFDKISLLAEAKRFAVLHRPPRFSDAYRLSGKDNGSERRIRVGYVSPDFRDHCQSLFTMPLLSNHDHSRYEIYCYAELARPDEISERLASYSDVWRMTYGKSDAMLAEEIVKDGIDILIDLTMYMAGGRPMLFAGKPAPVQVAWLAYPGTTGLPEMDYRLTDPWLDPPGVGDDAYSEISIRLPDTFWCYDPLIHGLEPNILPALTSGRVTFGCLNNFCKVSDESLCNWGRVMARLPGSCLILLAAAGKHRQRVFDLLDSHGVAAERIEFVEYRPRWDYLQTYQRIDICLDTLPYNGHTTSLDAYWMGVPVITQVGHTVVGRAGWSQLNNLGLSELAAFDEQAFVDIAVAMATDLPRLNRLRLSLRGRLLTSPLMDGKRFAESIETIYGQIRKSW